jgi:hypothetical protein
MKMRGLSALFFSIGLLPACSTEQVYEGARQMQQSQCVNEPAINYQQCLERSDMSYDEYARLRAESTGERP